MNIQTHTAYFKEPLYLESGRILEEYQIVYETYGELDNEKSNVIVVSHALSGSHHAAGRYQGDAKSGWWDALIGPNKALDTNKYFIICANNIGSCFGSTGPMSIAPNGKLYRFKFPVLAISDIVKAHIVLFKSLGIHKAKAVIGGSMGGMQALCYAIEYPDFAQHYICLASTAYTRPWTIALNKIAIEGIRNDPLFQNGEYDPQIIKEHGLQGLAYGRMAGHITFLSPDSLSKKFGRNYVENDGLYELFGRFEVERYLEYNGYNFAKYFDPLSYLYIIKTINIFDASRGSDDLMSAFAKITAKLHLISFRGDMLFFPQEMQEIYHMMCKFGKGSQVSYLEIESDYGHDAFLVEVDRFSNYIYDILENKI